MVGSEVERNDSGTDDVPGMGVDPDRNRSGTALMLSDGDEAEPTLAAANCVNKLLITRGPEPVSGPGTMKRTARAGPRIALESGILRAGRRSERPSADAPCRRTS